MSKKILRTAFYLGLVTLPLVAGGTSNRFLKEQISPPLPFEIFAPFSDPLPLPPHLVVGKNQRDITIHLTQFTSQLQKGFPKPTTMWGYNGTSPGPVIEVEENQKVRIHWQNDLPTEHLLKAPAAMMSSGPLPESRFVMNGPRTQESPDPSGMPEASGEPLPEVRNITHLHGAAVTESNPLDRLHNNDGWPDAWNVPGQEQIAEYPNRQDARTLWYHDHAFGETGRNVSAGLVGMYLIHDEFERRLNLPSGAYEIPLIFQTIQVNANGSLGYTDLVSNEFYGNAAAVNGKILPYLEVEPRKYRFRVLNASNARFYGLHLVDASDHSRPGPAFYQIGTDSGFLEKTATLNDPADPKAPRLLLAPAERADIIVDFSSWANRNFILLNTNSITDPDHEMPIPQLMEFKVGGETREPDTSALPVEIRKIEKLDPAKAARTRQIVLSQTDYPSGLSVFHLDNRSWSYKKSDGKGDYWDYEVDEKPVLHSTEVWELIDNTTMIHPFHVHLVQFQILDRRPFDADTFTKTGQVVYTGPAVPPDPNEAGWKDVVRANPFQVTRVIMRFEPYPGYFIYHCHILEHEDMDMMIPFQVVKH